MIILTISKQGNMFTVDDRRLPGSPPVGRGKSMMKAIGEWLHHNRDRVNIDFDLDKSALVDEEKRRKRELKKR